LLPCFHHSFIIYLFLCIYFYLRFSCPSLLFMFSFLFVSFIFYFSFSLLFLCFCRFSFRLLFFVPSVIHHVFIFPFLSLSLSMLLMFCLLLFASLIDLFFLLYFYFL
jgi:hypothetical protein